MSGPEAALLDSRREAAARAVLEGIAAGEALIALTGPAGTGKTAVLDLVAGQLAAARIRVLRIAARDPGGGRLPLRGLLAQAAGRDIGGMEEGAVEELLD